MFRGGHRFCVPENEPIAIFYVVQFFVFPTFCIFRIVGLGPAAEDNLGCVGLLAFFVIVSLASGIVTSTGIFFAYIVTRQEYLLDLVRRK